MWLPVLVVLVLVGAGCQYNPASFPDNPNLSECNGVPATMGIGWYEPNDGPDGSTYYGTEGDDVVVITNGPVAFFGLGGDDLICVNDTGMAWGDDGALTIQPGSGVDRIFNHSSYTGPVEISVVFDDGTGGDEFVGGPASERVWSGSLPTGCCWAGRTNDRKISTGDGDDYVEVWWDDPALLDGGPGEDSLDIFCSESTEVYNFEWLSWGTCQR